MVNRNALLNRVIMVEVEKEAAEPRPRRARLRWTVSGRALASRDLARSLSQSSPHVARNPRAWFSRASTLRSLFSGLTWRFGGTQAETAGNLAQISRGLLSRFI